MNVTMLYGLKVFAYGKAGALVLTDRETGEVYRIVLEDGVRDMSAYHPLLSAFSAEIVGCIVNNVAVGERRLVDQRAINFAETSAVPTYTPSDAVRFERMVSEIAARVAQETAAKAAARDARAAEFAAANPRVEADPRSADLVPGHDPVDPVLATSADVSAAKPDVIANSPAPVVDAPAREVEARADETK